MSRKKPIPQHERDLFAHWQQESLQQPLRTLAQHALGFHMGPVAADGSVMLPLPDALRTGDTAPLSVQLDDAMALYDPHGRPLRPLPPHFHRPYSQQPGALIFWLDEAALGRHAGEPLTPALGHKLEDRAADLLLALEAQYGIPADTLELRVCLPSEALRAQTGHRACAAIIVAAPPALGEKLDEIRQALRAQQQAAHAELAVKAESGKEPLGERLHLPPVRTPPRAPEEPKLPHAVPSPTVHAVVAQPKPPAPERLLFGSPLAEQLGNSVGHIEVHQLSPQDVIGVRTLSLGYQHFPVPMPVAINAESFGNRHRPTHVMTLWMKDPRLIPLYETVTRGGPDAEEAAERFHELLDPVLAWMHKEYGHPVQYYPMPMLGDKAPVMMVIATDTEDQRRVLTHARDRLQALRAQDPDHWRDLRAQGNDPAKGRGA